MTTIIQGGYTGFSIANLTQIKNYTEGVSDLPLTPITLTTSENYSKIYTLSLTVISSNANNLSINQSSSVGPLLVKSGNTYSITSQYLTSQGITINNWAYFKLAISGLSLHFKNSDWGETFNISATFSDGVTTLSDIIQIITTETPDATGTTQSINVPMAMNGTSLTSAGGSNVIIADSNQASKTYRVTYTVNDITNTTGTSNIFLNNSVTGQTSLKTFTVSGTQSYINSVIASSGVNNGLYFHNRSPSFYGQATISYIQEVLTTTESGVSVPYIQQTGTLTLNTIYTAPFAISTGLTYSEDVSPTFSLGSITDLSGTNWPSETCGVGSGLNCYTVTATVLGSFTTSNPVKLTYLGNPSITNSVTFTGSKSTVNTGLSSVILLPPADYVDPLTVQIVVSIGNTPVSIYTGNTTINCVSTHSEFSIIGGTSFILGNNTINFGSITDLAVSKDYTVTLDCLQSSATFGILTDLSGRGTWNSTGGTLSYGRLTISGTKANINTSLGAIRYTTGSGSTLSDIPEFLYTQIQNTNSVNQGTANISLSNNYVWGNGNYSGAFVFDENTKMTYNLGTINGTIAGTAKAEITLSTAFSSANGGSITGWTQVSDTVWTFSGTKTAVNTALAATEFITPADRRTNFTVDMKIYDNTTLIYSSISSASTKTFSIRTTYPYFSSLTPVQLLAGGDTITVNLGSVTDIRSTNISTAITYNITLTPSNLTQIKSINSSGSGGTSVWATGKLTLTGTKTQINSHLANISIKYLGNADSVITWVQTQTTNSTSQGTSIITVLKNIPQYLFIGPSNLARTNDLTNWQLDSSGNGISYASKTATYANSKWIVVSPNSLYGSNANITKSDTTLWTSSTIPAGITQVLYDDIYYAGTASSSTARITAWYDGMGGSGQNRCGVTYTNDDINYTTFQLPTIPPANTVNWPVGYINNVGGCSYNNGVFHIPSVDRDYRFTIATSTNNGSTWSHPVVANGTTSFCLVGKEVTWTNSKYGLPITLDGQLQLLYSDDGITWGRTIVSTITQSFNTTAAIYNGSYWIIVGYCSTDQILKVYKSSTATGGSWSIINLGVTADNIGSFASTLAYGNSTWVFKNSTKFYSSTDGLTWTERPISFTPYAIYCIKYLNNKFYALVARTNSSTVLMESSDGITWSIKYSFPTGTYTEIAYTG